MDFINEAILQYSEQHSQDESAVLQELSRETQAKILYPRMLSGHLQGRFLAAISRMIQPDRILEIGTYTGYSAICLAEGLSATGKLITIDVNDELHDMALRYFRKAGLAERIELLNGDAMKLIENLEGDFDIVFIDADKINYPNYFQKVTQKVRSGGWIIADNVLWSGNVLNADSQKDPETKAIMDFNRMVYQSEHTFKVLLPLRDGLFLLQKN